MKFDCYGAKAISGLGHAYAMHSQALSAFAEVAMYGMQERPTERAENVYFHGPPKAGSMIKEYTGRRIAYLVCESDVLDPAYEELAQHCTDIWTASSYCQQILESNLRRRVKLVPHCVSRFRYHPTQHEKPIVLTSFDGHSRIMRKNPIDTILAVRQAFGKDCQLIIKCKNIRKGMRDWINELTEGMDSVLIEGALSQEDMDKLYMKADIYTLLHCAEGFGLQLLEAMAFGCKVVATDFGGNTDFMNKHNSYPVQYVKTKVSDQFFKGHWATPIISSAAQQLRKAAADDIHVNRAAFLAALNYSPSNTIKYTARAL